MRIHHVLAVVAVVLIAAVVKIFITAPTAETNSLVVKNTGLNVRQLDWRQNLPAEKFLDMSLAFPSD